MVSVTGSPNSGRGTMNLNVNAASESDASWSIRSALNRTTEDQSDLKLLNFPPHTGISLTDLAPEAYLSDARNKSSSSHPSSTQSGKASSNYSAIIKSESSDKTRVSSLGSSIDMHMGETSHKSTHLRSARELVFDGNASSLSQGTGPLYGQQYPPSHVSDTRPATGSADNYKAGQATRAFNGSQAGPRHGGNNAIWNTDAPASYSAAGAIVSVNQQQYGAQPMHVYRASTYPTAGPRGPANMQIAPGYGFPHSQTHYGVVGSPLNANAAEFSHLPNSARPWNPSHLGKHVYLHPTQQINWRHLLEPGVTADWDFIVDKIITHNDQQASIFLQQKIKNSNADIKDNIIGSITQRGLELMGNRFGNFLIQRVFECANHAQIMGLASHIEGHTVRLSIDAFGCHVIQKAFDCVPEEFKHQMVHELLSRIRDTIVHRYACHVWQKLFELRWQGPPPMIMGTVNAALVGQWTQVATGETGSLVVQNIFENCNEQDKRPCINEVLTNLDQIARSQYGNWCIQHICEHGSSEDRDAATNTILARAADYSMDQYASKCIEKCLKVCGSDFLDRYLQQVLMRHPGDNFSPLVQSKYITCCSIASSANFLLVARDQYGNFLIQWILNNASPHLCDIVQAEIRKHLVSLRGNKYGSKVALTCGFGPQGVRPGVPFAPAHHRHHFPGPRGPPPQQHTVPNHSSAYGGQYHYHQLDGAQALDYDLRRPAHSSGPYGPLPAGPFNKY